MSSDPRNLLFRDTARGFFSRSHSLTLLDMYTYSYAREEFRHKSVTAPIVAGYIAGCGILGYEVSLASLNLTARFASRAFPDVADHASWDSSASGRQFSEGQSETLPRSRDFSATAATQIFPSLEGSDDHARSPETDCR